MSELHAARERTEAKAKYAAVHLTELKVFRAVERAQGTDWERAHQESFLHHLLGVRDALLQELNLFHACGIRMDQVRKADLRDRLEKLGKPSPGLDILTALEDDSKSWLSVAGRLRHFSTHQKNVPQLYHQGGDRREMIFLKDPLDGMFIEKDYVELFADWLESANSLVTDVRGKMPGAENA
jgi:hypothetical protein